MMGNSAVVLTREADELLCNFTTQEFLGQERIHSGWPSTRERAYRIFCVSGSTSARRRIGRDVHVNRLCLSGTRPREARSQARTPAKNTSLTQYLARKWRAFVGSGRTVRIKGHK